jgi:hypothetical protein
MLIIIDRWCESRMSQWPLTDVLMYHSVENSTYTNRCLQQCGAKISNLEITNNLKSFKPVGAEVSLFWTRCFAFRSPDRIYWSISSKKVEMTLKANYEIDWFIWFGLFKHTIPSTSWRNIKRHGYIGSKLMNFRTQYFVITNVKGIVTIVI